MSLKFCHVILTVFQYFLVKVSVVHLGEVGGALASPLEIASLQCIATMVSKLTLWLFLERREQAASRFHIR